MKTGHFNNVIDSGQTVRSVRTKNNVLQGNSEIYLECRTINLLMCDFTSYEIYLNSKIYPEMILTRNDPHFFRVQRFISEPLQAKYSTQRNSVVENNKK